MNIDNLDDFKCIVDEDGVDAYLPGNEMLLEYIGKDNYTKDIEREIDYYIKNVNKISTDKLNKEVSKAIEDIVYKRFGIPIVLDLKGDFAASYILHSIFSPFLDKNRLANIKLLVQDDYLKKLYKDIKGLFAKELEIDFSRAYIKGISKKYKSVITLDITNLVFKYRLTASEITAVLLHEIGHIFYTFVSLVLSTRDLFVMVDTIVTYNNNPDKILKKLKINTMEDVKNRIYEAVFVSSSKMKRYLDGIINDTYDDSVTFATIKESERLADSFVTSLGYSSELTSALTKLQVNDKKQIPAIIIENIITILIISIIVTILFIVVNLIVSPGFASQVFIHPSLLFFSFIQLFLISIAAQIIYGFIEFVSASIGLSDEENDYESPLERLLSMKRTLIGYLRKYGTNKNNLVLIKQVLAELDMLTALIKKQSDIFNHPVITMLTKGEVVAGEIRNPKVLLSNLLDKLTNNELYIPAAKLATKYSDNA